MLFKRPSWYIRAGKAVLFAAFIYKIARIFMKSVAGKRVRKRKDDPDIVEQVRLLLRNLR